MSLVLEWGHGQREQVATVPELNALLDRIAEDAESRGCPDAVCCDAGEAGRLDIVVGADWSFLHHVPANGGPPYMVSVGDPSADDVRAFYVYGDHYTEVLGRHTLPPDAARRAVEYFARTRQLAPDVQWEEV
jgi:hypothetical protein